MAIRATSSKASAVTTSTKSEPKCDARHLAAKEIPFFFHAKRAYPASSETVKICWSRPPFKRYRPPRRSAVPPKTQRSKRGPNPNSLARKVRKVRALLACTPCFVSLRDR